MFIFIDDIVLWIPFRDSIDERITWYEREMK